MARGGAISREASSNQRGLSSMPTETTIRTANASRMGRASDAARRLKSDRPTTIPARKAPSAIETPKSVADPTAMPSASTRTVRVNSSRARGRRVLEQPGDEAATDQQSKDREGGNL